MIEPPKSDPQMSAAEFQLLRDVIRNECGVHFPDDRAFLLANRLASRMQWTGCETYLDYYQLVRYRDGGETERAVEAATNNETYFFRECSQLDAVVGVVRAADRSRPVRVLAAGCSTGEEPYSLALLLDEAGLLSEDRVELIGVDIDRTALETAASGIYTAHSFRGTEGRYLDWYFSAVDDRRLRLDERIRRAVGFSRVNLLDGDGLASLGPFDVVLCRNVTIYFDDRSKARTIDNLTRLLAEDGLLFLGHSESLYGIATDLEVVRVGDAIGYRKARG